MQLSARHTREIGGFGSRQSSGLLLRRPSGQTGHSKRREERRSKSHDGVATVGAARACWRKHFSWCKVSLRSASSGGLKNNTFVRTPFLFCKSSLLAGRPKGRIQPSGGRLLDSSCIAKFHAAEQQPPESETHRDGDMLCSLALSRDALCC